MRVFWLSRDGMPPGTLCRLVGEGVPDIFSGRPPAHAGVAPSTAAVSAEQMKLVLNVSRMLAATADLDRLLLRIAEATTALLDCERASIFLHDSKAGELWTKVALQSTGIRIPSNKGIAGHAFTHNEILHVPAPYQDARFNPQPDRASGFVTRNLLAVPMADWEHRPVGVAQAINKRDGGFNDADIAMLQMVADQAGMAIQRHHLQQAAMESSALRKEMELAKRVQEALLPRGAVTVGNLASDGWTRPASINGGDCFDLWSLPDGRLGVLVADASGHGIAPALVVSQVRALVRTLADLELDPATIMRRMNRRLAADLDRGRFCTVFLAFIDQSGLVDWCSAGHGPILLRNNHSVVTLNATFAPVGILDELPGDAAAPAVLSPGGTLVVTTDGITEAHNQAGEMFKVDRLSQIIAAADAQTPKSLLTAIRQQVDEWQGGTEQQDDQTAVVVTREI